MFGFLKDKLKQAIDSFKKKAEEEVEEVETVEVAIEKPIEKKEVPKKEEKEEKLKKVDKEKKKKLPKKVLDEDVEPEARPAAEAEPEIEPVAEKIEKDIDLEVEPGALPPRIAQKEPDITPIEVPVEEDISQAPKEEEKEKKEEAEQELDYVEEDKVEEIVEEKPKKSGGFFGLFKKKEKKEEKPREEKKAEKKPEAISEAKILEGSAAQAPREPEAKKAPKAEAEPKEAIEESKPAETEDEQEETTSEHETSSESQVPEEPKKKGFFAKLTESVTKVSLSDKKFDELFWEIEVGLLENNVAIEVIDKIKADLKKELVEGKFPKKELESRILKALRKSISDLFDVPTIDLIQKAKGKKPFVIVFIGINGTGKTTTLAKITNLFLKNGLKPVMGACDTFRAAAIQQLEEHANNLGVKIIKHNYGSDPAAVAFDTIEHAKAHGKDVVLIDTAGRLHSNKNLMQELEKVIKIAKPDLKIFIGESLAGNDVVEQVKLFNDSVGIDGIVLSKADTDEKGGAAISVSYITGKPIIYLGTGQGYEDIEKFDKEKLLKQIGL